MDIRKAQIGVEYEHFLAALAQHRRKVDSESGFANAAFTAANTDNGALSWLSLV
jgi:hypothetical protein